MEHDGGKRNPPPVIGGIIRVSSEHQADEGQSPQNQRDVLTRAGATAFYEDVVSGSAKGGNKRRQSPVWQQLITDVTSGKLTQLLVCEVARIARRDALIMELVELCDQHGVEFLSTNGGQLTAKTAPSWLSVKQQAVFAEYFAREQSDKIKRAQASCVARGVFGFTDAHIPWHLQRDPDDKHRVIARPDCWDSARELVMGYIEGRMTMKAICATVYQRHGVLRHSSAVTKWLRSAWLRGHYGKRDGQILIANIAPALVTEAEAALLLQRIDSNRKDHGTRAPHKKHALTGLCQCVSCGQIMTTCQRKGRGGKVYSYVRCGQPDCVAFLHNIPMQRVETALQELLDEADLETMEREGMRRQQVTTPSKELLNLRTAVKRMQEALALFDSPGIRADLQTAQRRIADLEAAHQPEEPRLTLRQLQEVGSEQWWSQRDDHQRNLDYLSVVDYVTVDGESAEAKGRHLLSLKFKGWRWNDDGELELED